MAESPLIRRTDQLVLASIAGLLFAWLALGWITARGCSAGLIDPDTAGQVDYTFTVDLNEAEWPELAQLPGIGEVLARRIVALREEEGPFRSIADLRRVQGIGPRKLEQARRYLMPLEADQQVAEVERE